MHIGCQQSEEPCLSFVWHVLIYTTIAAMTWSWKKHPALKMPHTKISTEIDEPMCNILRLNNDSSDTNLGASGEQKSTGTQFSETKQSSPRWSRIYYARQWSSSLFLIRSSYTMVLSGLDMSRDMLNNIFRTRRGSSKFPTGGGSELHLWWQCRWSGGQRTQPQKLRWRTIPCSKL